MLFYNPDIFAGSGIEVPEDYQFTTDEFLEVVQKCSDAGYAGVADAIGNAPIRASGQRRPRCGHWSALKSGTCTTTA